MAGLSLIPTREIHSFGTRTRKEKNSMPHFDALTQIFTICSVFVEVFAITLHGEGYIFCTSP
jgi:hypothetical protein